MNPDAARAISLLGHPLAVLPSAAMLLAGRHGAAAQAAWIGAGLVAFALLVLAWSWRQVRAGRWAHIDASEPHERKSLNAWLLCAMAPGAGLAWWQGNGALAAGLGVSAGVILVAPVWNRRRSSPGSLASLPIIQRPMPGLPAGTPTRLHDQGCRRRLPRH